MFENVTATKEKIYRIAARLFSQLGYHGTSLHEIARNVGIKMPSIYRHFKDKREILDGLYEIYMKQRAAILPNVNRLLALAEVLPVRDVLMRMDFHFAPDVEELANKIIAIAAHLITSDEPSRDLINKCVWSLSREMIIPLVERLIELKKIEPIDVEMFSHLLEHYCFSAVALNESPMKVRLDEWRRGLDYLFTLAIKPI